MSTPDPENTLRKPANRGSSSPRCDHHGRQRPVGECARPTSNRGHRAGEEALMDAIAGALEIESAPHRVRLFDGELEALTQSPLPHGIPRSATSSARPINSGASGFTGGANALVCGNPSSTNCRRPNN